MVQPIFIFSSEPNLPQNFILREKWTIYLISGNRNNRGFNEVQEMRNRIINECSGHRAGVRIRWNQDVGIHPPAKESYHLQKVIVVTDAFHAPRAIFLCRHFGIDAVAICPAKDPMSWWFVRYNVKEYFARLIAVFDIMTRKNHEPSLQPA